MGQLKCQNCGRIVSGKESEIDSIYCAECHGRFAVLDPNNNFCSHCKKKFTSEDDDDEGNICNSCGDENLCENCVIGFDEDCDGEADFVVCKKCIDKVYPRKIETKIEYKEKIVEKPIKVFIEKNGTPIDSSFNPNAKSKFD